MNIKRVDNQNNILGNNVLKNKNVFLNNNISNTFSVKTFAPIKPANFQAYYNISFKASMQEHLGQGARYLGNGNTRFTITAPFAERIMITVFSGDIEKKTDISVQRQFLDKKGDKFESVLNNTKPGDEYSYTVVKKDGSIMNLYDPRADFLPNDIDDYKPTSNLAEIIDHSSFKWSDDKWMQNRVSSNKNKVGWGLPEQTIIESVHMGLLGGFKEAKKEIDKIAESGVATAVRVMPIGEFYGKNNWGYDEVAKFAVENGYGRPEDFKDFVNYAHSKGINVILDVVPNHFGPFGSIVQELMPIYSEGEKTPWGAYRLEFSGEKGKYMRSYMTDMLMNWAVNYHVDGFRFDATHFVESDTAMQDIIKDLRSHKETKELLLYPEDLRIARKMANSNSPKEVSDNNWGFNAMTTFDFYKSLIANITGFEKHGCQPDLSQLEHIYKNVVIKSHEQTILDENKADPGYIEKCRRQLNFLLPQSADNFIVNISNNDEIGNEAGGKRNLLNILSSNLKLVDRCGGDWKQSQALIFEMTKYYVKNGACLPEDIQRKYNCKNHVSNEQFDLEFKKAYEINKLLLGALFMHPSPKEFFMGDDRGELAPLKFFCEMPASAVDPNTHIHYLKYMEDEKGYPANETAFNESKMNQEAYNAKWINEGTQNFSKDFAKLIKTSPVFHNSDLKNQSTYAHNNSNILEIKRFNESGEVIAVVNLSSSPQYHFQLRTTTPQELKEILNSNDTRYNGNGEYNNKWKKSIYSNELTIPPNGIVVFEPAR